MEATTNIEIVKTAQVPEGDVVVNRLSNLGYEGNGLAIFINPDTNQDDEDVRQNLIAAKREVVNMRLAGL